MLMTSSCTIGTAEVVVSREPKSDPATSIEPVLSSLTGCGFSDLKPSTAAPLHCAPCSGVSVLTGLAAKRDLSSEVESENG